MMRTLADVIRDGIHEAASSGAPAEDIVLAHIRDHLAQRFTAAMMRNDGDNEPALKELWASVLGAEGEVKG